MGQTKGGKRCSARSVTAAGCELFAPFAANRTCFVTANATAAGTGTSKFCPVRTSPAGFLLKKLQHCPSHHSPQNETKSNLSTQGATMDELLLIAEVSELTRLSESWIHKAWRQGRFPAPLRLSRRAIRWRASDIQQWISSRTPAGVSRDA